MRFTERRRSSSGNEEMINHGNYFTYGRSDAIGSHDYAPRNYSNHMNDGQDRMQYYNQGIRAVSGVDEQDKQNKTLLDEVEIISPFIGNRS